MLGGLETAWVSCDQAIASNVKDLASTLVGLYNRSGSFMTWLGKRRSQSHQDPRSLFGKQMATRPLQQTNKQKCWMARVVSSNIRGYLRSDIARPGNIGATFDAVVHFVQAGSGTGVRVVTGWY